MKIRMELCSLKWRLVAGAAFVYLTAPYFCSAAQPSITSIRPDTTNVVVQVTVPSGFERITLESRARFGQGTWSPLAVTQTLGAPTNLSFQIACSRQTELMRVRADASQALPSSFYNGKSSFAASPSSGPATATPSGGGVVDSGGTTPTANGDSSRPVVESDIWALDGDRLYFFNQYRGLQVIDISNPDTAQVLGTLALPAAGEQMYLPDSGHVVLLANGPCGYGTDPSQIIVLSVSNGTPVVVTNLPTGGWLHDSRMVGTALYVASQYYRPVPGSTNNLWESGTVINSFDLSEPEHPSAISTLFYPGYGNVVSASDTFLFVITQDPINWWQSSVQIIDITSPDGSMAFFGSVRTSGTVSDKFKLNFTNSIFTAISEDWRSTTAQGPVTKLETFKLPDPSSTGPSGIVKLGELQLGSGEQLHATRFDGNLVYVVTFFQIDPLWVVDLSDPAKPHIAGSVNIPGWSTYIYPLGDRLVTLGVETNRVAVSLFDVHDPSQPALMSHLLLGQNYSWSDANYDEKAFTVLTDQGLVLVPYNGDTTNGWTMQVQLLDLNRTNLVARGIINHQSQPRRTAFSHDRILSLSGWELLSVDATDRDHPVVKGDTSLAWSVDRLVVQGDYLLELSASTGFWGYQSSPGIRVTPLHQPDKILNELTLDGLPIVGASLNNGRLYVAQSLDYFWYPILPSGSGGSGGDSGTNAPNFFLTVLDVSHLPNVSVLGQTGISLDSVGWGSSWTALWPKQDVLVWTGGGNSWLWAVPVGVLPAGPTGVTTGTGSLFPWWGFNSGGQLLAFDVSNPAQPALDSEVNLATNGWWGFSQSFLSDTRVYLSYNQSTLLTNVTYPMGVWVQFSQLDVIDYADPHAPTVRAPVNIPGTLQGISHGGELLYTVGTHWDTNQLMNWSQWLDASAYDGVAAHLVASLQLSDYWPHPVLVLGSNVLIGLPGYSPYPTNVVTSQLQTWTVSDAGSFVEAGSLTLGQPANTIIDRNGLLVCQETDNSLDLFDDSSPADLSLLKHDQPSSCLWYDLNSADGALNRGLWLPLGAYGVKEVDLGP
jgi:hypothetical protein